VLRPFRKLKGVTAGAVRRKQVAALSRLEEEESRMGPCGSERRGGAGREAEAQWGGGERAGWGGREVAAAGLKTGARPKFKK
jgi:hypothetical protein